jgi:hypothetical protein
VRPPVAAVRYARNHLAWSAIDKVRGPRGQENARHADPFSQRVVPSGIDPTQIR